MSTKRLCSHRTLLPLDWPVSVSQSEQMPPGNLFASLMLVWEVVFSSPHHRSWESISAAISVYVLYGRSPPESKWGRTTWMWAVWEQKNQWSYAGFKMRGKNKASFLILYGSVSWQHCSMSEKWSRLLGHVWVFLVLHPQSWYSNMPMDETDPEHSIDAPRDWNLSATKAATFLQTSFTSFQNRPPSAQIYELPIWDKRTTAPPGPAVKKMLATKRPNQVGLILLVWFI